MCCLTYNITKSSCNSKMASKSQLYHYNSTLDCLAELQLCQQPCRSPFYGMLSPLITLSPFVALPFPGIPILVPKLCCNRGCVQCSVHSAKPFLPRLYWNSFICWHSIFYSVKTTSVSCCKLELAWKVLVH